jgi:hypothetical protein
VELGRVFLEALPLQITRHDYPLRDWLSVRAVICSPGWAEYNKHVLYLEKISGGDMLNAILVLQCEEERRGQRRAGHQCNRSGARYQAALCHTRHAGSQWYTRAAAHQQCCPIAAAHAAARQQCRPTAAAHAAARLQALDSMQQQLASRKQQPRSGSQHQQVGVSYMALGFAAVQNLDTQVEALAQQAAKGGKLQLPDHFQVKPMADRGSDTMIRPDMSAATGITVWDFIQSAAAHRLCPQRAKEEWFDSRLPSMQQSRRKRGVDQE